jgi:Ca2+-binding EF-hand superfamily protein
MLKLHRSKEVEVHFRKLVAMKPPNPDPYIAYADWLGSVGRFADGSRLLDLASGLYPDARQLHVAHRRFYLSRDAADRIAALKALDPAGSLSLSEGAVFAAPAALAALDKDGDGTLSPEEFGADFGDESRLDRGALERLRREFMQSQPVWLALDTDRDGVISAQEIRNASRALPRLDPQADGELTVRVLDPPWVVALAKQLLTRLDTNHDGAIDSSVRSQPAAEQFRDLLEAADLDASGAVTLDELISEIFYRADLNKDGTVTLEEMERAIRGGVLGPIAPRSGT